jgi:hypothetical protein
VMPAGNAAQRPSAAPGAPGVGAALPAGITRLLYIAGRRRRAVQRVRCVQRRVRARTWPRGLPQLKPAAGPFCTSASTPYRGSTGSAASVATARERRARRPSEEGRPGRPLPCHRKRRSSRKRGPAGARRVRVHTPGCRRAFGPSSYLQSSTRRSSKVVDGLRRSLMVMCRPLIPARWERLRAGRRGRCGSRDAAHQTSNVRRSGDGQCSGGATAFARR